MWKTVSASAQGAPNPEVDGYASWPIHQLHQSSSPHPRERAWKSTLPRPDTFVATRDLTGLCLALGAGPSAWRMHEPSQRRVVIVVVGVTPHQGDGSAVTGRRTTGNVVQAPVRMEELDLMDDPRRELEHLRKLAAAEPTKRFGMLYRLVSHPQMLSLAGEHVRQNTGGRTAGIDGQTRRHIDPDMLTRLAEELGHNRYHPQAVRRLYIPKGTTGRRGLGIPTIRDRIVQAVVAQILAAIYEPIFRPCSYGFRPHRNPIHALHHVAQAYRAGATWIIEGDLVHCFDAIPHHVIVQCLRKRIKDERFIDLVRQMLTAGVMEEGTFLPTYSGTPQGGLASPVLCNVVLHELDCWMEEHWQANPAPLTPKQQYARANPEYVRHKRNLVRWRAQLRGQIPLGRQTPEGLQIKIKHALTCRKHLPSVLPRRLISYCRYADDYVVVLCQYSKADAQHLKAAMAQGLAEHLGLTQHPEKTHITHWDRRFRFLGYDLRGQRNPHGTRWLRLTIPPEKERALKTKVKRLCQYTQIPALDLFMSVNALLRGWTQYFRYAHNAPRRFRYLTGVAYWLCAHYLGRKHRCSIKQVMRIAYGVDPASHKRALYTCNGGKRVYLWNKPPPRGSLFSKGIGAKDVQPLPLTSWATGRSYAQRVAVAGRAGQHCEQCDNVAAALVVHHPHRLGQVRKHKRGPANVIASGQEQQVKLLCPACHKQHHPGGWQG
jgi:RNA-directed DNA polymerase